MTRNKSKNGFTLIELLAVVIILITVMLIALISVNKQMKKSRVNAFIDEANVFAKASAQKYYDSKSGGILDPGEDLFYGSIKGKTCYSIQNQLLGSYVEKANNKYVGSVEFCYSSDCEYQTKVWMSDGEFYIDGETNIDDKSKVKGNFTTEYPYSCGVEAVGSGGTSGSLTTAEFDYTGKERKFAVTRDGIYSLEAWGAQGGSFNQYSGGYGAYAYTEVELHQGDILYVRIGGKGEDVSGTTAAKGGWNDGANGYNASSYVNTYAGGGGLTSIATKSGPISSPISVSNVYLIAGGGATARYGTGTEALYARNGYNAGGYIDESECAQETTASIQCPRQGTSSTTGYTRVSYGKSSTNNGAGGGYYTNNDDNGYLRRSGGISYIGNPITRNGVMYGVNVPETSETKTKTINTTNYSDKPIAGYGKIENGYAKITYIGTYSS